MIFTTATSPFVDALSAATPLVTAIGVLVTVVMQAWNSYTSARRAEVIEKLEKNTNSIKDALLKTTGEAEHAKGVVQGRAEVIEAHAAIEQK